MFIAGGFYPTLKVKFFYRNRGKIYASTKKLFGDSVPENP
jgi:hypothetical protein